MKATIHSVDSDRQYATGKKSNGKTAEVRASEFKLSSFSGHLMIEASYKPFFGYNDRDGLPKNITRTLTLSLTAEEVGRIVKSALADGLIAVSLTTSKSA